MCQQKYLYNFPDNIRKLLTVDIQISNLFEFFMEIRSLVINGLDTQVLFEPFAFVFSASNTNDIAASQFSNLTDLKVRGED